MNSFISKGPEANESVYFLSDIIHTKVISKGKKIGKLRDIAIVEHDKIPEVTHFIISRPFGYKPLLVPWERIIEIGKKAVTIDIESPEKYEGEPEESQVLLNDHILDKKVIDMDDKEIDVVYDVKLVLRHGRLYVTDVDFSRYGLLKRLGLAPIAKMIYSLAEIFKKETLSWAYVQPLPEHIGSFKGNVKLNVLKEKLPEIHPVDLADILEELDEGQRTAIFNELEMDHASDTLEEIEPRVQRSLISSMSKEKVADLIDEMTAAQAADVLSVLPASDAEEILNLMEHEEAKKIKSLLEEQNDTITNLTTSSFIFSRPTDTISEVIEHYHKVAPEMDVTNYVFVLDGDNKLIGVLGTQDLLMAEPSDKLEDVMNTQVISLDFTDSIAKASEMFTRYGFRAIPVTDKNEVIQGVIPYRDVMNLEHKFS
ncbi:MAG: CBS domain-containing protein [Thermodesulfobacteriota bacterium]|jgi:CBS domain-containing protein/sporulation protein YlmC with PRC-barrel domain